MPTMKMMSSALRLGIITVFGASIRFSIVNNEPLCLVEGLVNVPPFSQHRHRVSCCPSRRHTFVYNSRDTTATTSDESPTTLTPTEPSSSISVAGNDIQTSIVQTTITSITSQTPSKSVEIASQGSQKRDKPAQRMGVWMPPSKNVDQKRGKIFSIQRPQDLLDFVIEDERLSVVKVYASWCKTCQVFDVRYRGLAAKYGDKSDSTRDGRVRFAEMQYDNPNNEELCQLLNATKLPYMLMYKGSRGKVKEFHCSPAKFQLLIDAINELGDDLASTDTQFIPEVIDNVVNSDVAKSIESNPEEDSLSLHQQLERDTAEKLELFEVMEAQSESDKEYIQKLERNITAQQSTLDAKDIELLSLQKSYEKEMQSLSNELTRQQDESNQLKADISAYQIQVHQLNQRISELEYSITSLELESSFNKNLAKDKEHQLQLSADKLEEQKNYYEKERSSLRKLALLGMKRVVSGPRSLFLRFKGKEDS